jgi:hypothetical protein
VENAEGRDGSDDAEGSGMASGHLDAVENTKVTHSWWRAVAARLWRSTVAALLTPIGYIVYPL